MIRKSITILVLTFGMVNISNGQIDTQLSSNGLAIRFRLLYANYSGTEPLLPPGSTKDPNNNLNGDGFGGDVFYKFSKFNIGLTASSVLFLSKANSYVGAIFVSKSLSKNKWSVSFGLGMGGVNLFNAVESEQITRPAMSFQSNLDYYIKSNFFVGFQVQSWIALGPEDDLGLSSGSFAIGYDF